MTAGRPRRSSNAAVEKQRQFVGLIRLGVSNSEACRRVGINRRTGTRWRFGRKILNRAGEPVEYPAVPTTLPAIRHPRYLSLEERLLIADLHRERLSVREIARRLGRSASTVSRELRRNADPAGRYRPHVADKLAIGRTARPRLRRVQVDAELRAAVTEMLAKRWNPDLVSHELRLRFTEPERRLCTESIYQAIYDRDVDLTRPAKRRRRGRRRRTQGLERRGRRLCNMQMIASRPAQVTDRVEPGHWEGDCVMGPGNRSAIGTLVERRTRFLILVHVPTGRPTAEAMRAGIVSAMGSMPAHLRRTLTWDQGKELAMHRQISEAIGTKVYFCDPHSPWQRPTNEHTNGLLRDYFAKGEDLRHASPWDLLAVAEELNTRPRRTLGWAKPADLFAALQQPSCLLLTR
jgi:IS30 family transposase